MWKELRLELQEVFSLTVGASSNEPNTAQEDRYDKNGKGLPRPFSPGLHANPSAHPEDTLVFTNLTLATAPSPGHSITQTSPLGCEGVGRQPACSARTRQTGEARELVGLKSRSSVLVHHLPTQDVFISTRSPFPLTGNVLSLPFESAVTVRGTTLQR